ncbi:hypothetical protein AB1N83_003840 [Pleurotus pulmonarius]
MMHAFPSILQFPSMVLRSSSYRYYSKADDVDQQSCGRVSSRTVVDWQDLCRFRKPGLCYNSERAGWQRRREAKQRFEIHKKGQASTCLNRIMTDTIIPSLPPLSTEIVQQRRPNHMANLGQTHSRCAIMSCRRTYIVVRYGATPILSVDNRVVLIW